MSNLASAALALQQAQSQPVVMTATEAAINAASPANPQITKRGTRRAKHQLLGQEFKVARQNKYMSQWDVANKANLSRRTVSRVEQFAYAKIDTFMSIADALDMELTLKALPPAPTATQF